MNIINLIENGDTEQARIELKRQLYTLAKDAIEYEQETILSKEDE